MFSDETNIQPEQIGEPTEQLSTFLQSTQGSSRDQLWYGVEFSAHGMNDFHVVEGRLNASDYIGILEDKVVPFTVRVFRNGEFIISTRQCTLSYSTYSVDGEKRTSTHPLAI